MAWISHVSLRGLSLKSAARIVLGLAISGLFIWLTVRQVDVAQVRAALAQAQLGFLIPAIATYFVSVAIRAWRWSLILRPVRAVSWRQLYPAVIIGHMGNMLLTARLGDLLRATVLGRRLGRAGGASAGLGSVAAEGVLDGLGIVGIMVITTQFLPRPPWLSAGLPLVTLVFVAALIALVSMLALRSRLVGWLQRWIGRFAWAGRPLGLLEHFLAGLEAVRDPRLFGGAAAITLLGWLSSAFEFYWVFRAFDLPLGVGASLFTVSAVGLSLIIPSAPAYVGTFEFAGVAVLTTFGIPAAKAFSAILLVHMVDVIPVTLLGLALAWRETMVPLGGGAVPMGKGAAHGREQPGLEAAP